MVSSKHRHSKDKLYLLPSELALTQAPVRSNRPSELVPLDSCFLTLNPFSNPFCTINGHIFDYDKIKEFITLYGKNPINSLPLSLDDLFPLHFTKDENGFFQCPLSLKRFTSNSHIVTVKPSGYVYSYNTLKEVAKKEIDGFMHDPITGVKFGKNDIITIQDPHNTTLRTISNFKHINSYFKPKSTQSTESNTKTTNTKSTHSLTTDNTTQSVTSESTETKHGLLEEHLKIFKNDKSTDINRPKHELFTTGSQAASFTSTATTPSYKVEYRDKTVFEVRLPLYDYVKKNKQKAYVKLVTTDGDLNLLLHTDRVPVTCDSFLQHCEDKYYDGCEFFRSVSDFMIQTGDPTNTGLGGESAFYTRAKRANLAEKVPKYLRDEFDNTLYHVGTGVLSMANKGKHTNGSQFFITFTTCSHLDNVHTVFGKVVGGLEILRKWNTLKVDDEERPLNPPKILQTIIYSNPFEDAKVSISKELEEKKLQEKKRVLNSNTKWLLNPQDNTNKKYKSNKIGYLINK
uniref:Peptidyl-prolyl cis-trans isomerase, putative n=1 Tax=Theileria annulata TaxID=5874 RepID=A0A3B0MMN3_THEAN